MNSSSFELQTFERIPLFALSAESRNCLASYLDADKILSTPDGFSRDWRGLFHLSGLRNQYKTFFSSKTYPTIELINVLEKVPDPITFSVFRCNLETIDRYDVLDDMYEMFVADALRYLETHPEHDGGGQQEHVDTPIAELVNPDCLTMDDVIRAGKGLPLQQYDAFVLFADEDREFANELIKKVEEFGFKVCYEDRDFLIKREPSHDAIRTLLTKRCDRLVVILSPELLSSPVNVYIPILAQWLGIIHGTRKLIPCLYKECDLPEIFQGINVLDYEKSQRFNNFWERLKLSLQMTSNNRIACPQNYVNTLQQLPIQRDTQRSTGSCFRSFRRNLAKYFTIRSGRSNGSFELDTLQRSVPPPPSSDSLEQTAAGGLSHQRPPN